MVLPTVFLVAGISLMLSPDDGDSRNYAFGSKGIQIGLFLFMGVVFFMIAYVCRAQVELTAQLLKSEFCTGVLAPTCRCVLSFTVVSHSVVSHSNLHGAVSIAVAVGALKKNTGIIVAHVMLLVGAIVVLGTLSGAGPHNMDYSPTRWP